MTCVLYCFVLIVPLNVYTTLTMLHVWIIVYYFYIYIYIDVMNLLKYILDDLELIYYKYIIKFDWSFPKKLLMILILDV